MFDAGVGTPSLAIEYTMMRAREAASKDYQRSEDLANGRLYPDIHILQLGFGRRPISNPTCASAEGPVVKEPPSASGSSVLHIHEWVLNNLMREPRAHPWMTNIYT